MSETLPRPPGHHWTADDLEELGLLEVEGVRHEALHGELLVTREMTVPHQYAAFRLGRLLDDAAPPHLLVLVPSSGVVVGDGLLVPDAVVLDRQGAREARYRMTGGVRLVVEVASPSTVGRDRLLKLRGYAEAGVASYWLVDVRREPVVQVLELEGDTYGEPRTWRGDETVDVALPFPLRFAPSDLVL